MCNFQEKGEELQETLDSSYLNTLVRKVSQSSLMRTRRKSEKFGAEFFKWKPMNPHRPVYLKVLARKGGKAQHIKVVYQLKIFVILFTLIEKPFP